jgi:hypothetical protein
VCVTACNQPRLITSQFSRTRGTDRQIRSTIDAAPDLPARTMYDRAVAAWWKDGPVPSLEERVAYLEGRTEEHAAAMVRFAPTFGNCGPK